MLQRLLSDNRAWLQPWEATLPGPHAAADLKTSIRSLLAQQRQGTGAPFLVEYEGTVVGQVSVGQITYGSLSSGMLGYWISEAYAGRSITPVAVALTADYLFHDCNLHRVEICIRPENARSRRVVEKLGFRFEGLRRRYIHIAGRWCDHYAFALTREDVPLGVLQRYLAGDAPSEAAQIPEEVASAAAHPFGAQS